MSSEDMEDARKAIMKLTLELVGVLDRRSSVALDIGKAKAESGVFQVRDREREACVIELAKKCNKGPLSDEAVGRIMQVVIDEASALQAERFELPLGS